MNEIGKNLEAIGEGTAFTQRLYQMIADSNIFADLSRTEIGIIAGYMRAYRAEAGVTIFSEGDPGDYLCLLISGSIDVVKRDGDLEKVVATVPVGRIIGEMAIIDGQNRSASCVARESVTLAILTRSKFQSLMGAEPVLGSEILMKIARILSESLRRTSGQLVDYLDS